MMQVDWKATALTNWAIDVHQTMAFSRYGYEEKWNPIGRTLLQHEPIFFVASVGFVVLAENWIERQKSKKLLYAAWAAIHMLAAHNNAKITLGLPVLSMRF